MANPKYKTESKAPSDVFIDTVLSENGVGSSDMECGWCNRLHLCPDTYMELHDFSHIGLNEDDVKNYIEYCDNEKEKNPDGVVLHYNTDAVSGRELNGINFVIDCPCNGLTKYENFIWAHRDLIRNYLQARVDKEYEFYKQEQTKNKLANLKSPIWMGGYSE